MANTKSKKKTEKTSSKAKTAAPAKAVTSKNTKPMKGFFARKCDVNENILTIFKSPRIYGAIIGEAIGTMLLTMLLLTLGIYQPIYLVFGLIAITIMVYAFSGAHLNPLVTVGMMATRRVSAIRGVLYILAQVVGAWLGLIIVSAFLNGSGSSMELPSMAEVASEDFWAVTLIEFLGASVFAFAFARALSYKKSVFTFSAVVAGGFVLAVLFAIVISSNFFSYQNNFVLNPAVAIMYQIFPNTGDSFGALVGDICLALLTYVIFPMLGGIVGFYISEFTSRLSGEETCCDCE